MKCNCSFSTNIAGHVTKGHGSLDEWGFWEFSCIHNFWCFGCGAEIPENTGSYCEQHKPRKREE